MISTRTAMGGVLATLAGAAMAGAAAPSAAQTMSLRDQLFGAPSDERTFSIPLVARFQTDAGEPFILDRSPGRNVLLKFDASSEIWALEPTPGPRGDMIYKNDMGEAMLRATRLGGLTLFTADRPNGVAAAFAGASPLLRAPTVVTEAGLLQTLVQASERAGRAVGRPVVFSAEGVAVPISTVSLMADAAAVAAEAFVEVASQGDRQKRSLVRYARVRIGVGKAPAAQAVGDTVTIRVVPDRGPAGRPSSLRVAAALTRR